MNRRVRYLRMLCLLGMVLIIAACGKVEGKTKEVNFGYQKTGAMLSLKKSDEFKEELEELGYKLTWSEFNTGSSILEALNAGSIDFANAGDIPSLFALDKGSDFNYIASEPDVPDSEGILVSEESDIQSLADLKGKRVAFNQASIAQYLLSKSLETVDLTLDDIEAVYLTPPDASIAFSKGDVDAWVVWDPYLAVAESQGNVVLQNAEGIVPFRSFYFSTDKIAKEDPELVEVVIKHLTRIGEEIEENPVEIATLMEKETQIDAKTWEVILKRKKSDVRYIDDAALEDLQTQVADLLELELIENDIPIEDYVWHPENK